MSKVHAYFADRIYVSRVNGETIEQRWWEEAAGNLLSWKLRYTSLSLPPLPPLPVQPIPGTFLSCNGLLSVAINCNFFLRKQILGRGMLRTSPANPKVTHAPCAERHQAAPSKAALAGGAGAPPKCLAMQAVERSVVGCGQALAVGTISNAAGKPPPKQKKKTGHKNESPPPPKCQKRQKKSPGYAPNSSTKMMAMLIVGILKPLPFVFHRPRLARSGVGQRSTPSPKPGQGRTVPSSSVLESQMKG